MNPRVALCLGMYRRLARAFPHEFWMVYGEDMERMGQDAIPEIWRRHGFFGLLKLLVDIAVRLPLEYFAEFRQDATYALRNMMKAPGFTAVAILSLGLAIGVSGSLVSLLSALVLRPMPGARDAAKLVGLQNGISYRAFESLRDQPGLAAGATAFLGPVPFGVSVSEGVTADRIYGHVVSPEYFSVLGVTPAMGRFFDPSLDKPGSEPAVVVSERFWRRHLNSDPHVIGRTLRVNGKSVAIAGVGPRDFLGVFPANPADLFLAATTGSSIAPELTGDELHSKDAIFRTVLRMNDGASIKSTEAAIGAVLSRAHVEDSGMLSERPQGWPVELIDAGGAIPLPRQQRSLLFTVYGVLIALLLSLACANLAGLVLARGSARGKEIAIRLAVGASRFRLVRQMVTESVILGCTGGAAGLVLTYWLLRLTASIQNMTPVPMDYNLQVDLRAVLATFAMGALAGIGFGLMPALVSTRAQVASALKEGTLTGRRRYRRFGLRNLFVVYQVAAAMMLLLMIGYVLVGYHNTAHLDPGFDTSRLDVFTLDPARDGYSAAESSALLTELPGRLAQVSGVSGATVADRIPLGFGTAVPDLAVSVSRGNAGDFSMQVLVQQIGANYFATLGLPLVSGTEFSERDERREVHANEIPVVINQTAARVLFPEGNVLGARIRAGSFSHTVIGVVRDAKPGFMNAKPMATLFRPMSLLNSPRGLPQGATVVVRGAGVDTLAAVRRALAATEPRLTILNPQALSEFLAEAGRAVEWSSALNGGIALFGLILAAIGLAGVTAQEVVRRRKEIGIRMALGARRRQVLWLVLAQSAVMVTVGTAIGFAGGFGVSRALSSLTSQLSDVFGEGTGDRALTVGAPALLIALAAIACYLPARRSMRIDPLTALREE